MKTLWSGSEVTRGDVLAYTVGDDRLVDAELLPWDVLGSIGHVHGLVAAGLLTGADHRALVAALRAGYRAARRGRLIIGPEHEDGHSAVEAWLTRRIGAIGERVHTGRSRNDQIAVDLRLWAKDRVLTVHHAASAAAAALLGFARRERRSLWPGYTHLRRAMPSSAGVWAAAFAEGLIDTLESTDALWRQLDRSPLGSAAGYGAPLPLDRERVAKALGFRGVEHAIGAVQNGRGKLEAALLFWGAQLGHDLAKLATDVVLLSGEEFGLLALPESLATGSSIMPHKRNPDLFELTRARAALVEGHLAATLALRSKLTSGYHRDFQLLKGPLLAGMNHLGAMAEMMAAAVPLLAVDRGRGRAMLVGGALATDEVMRRVEAGTPFRRAYREVAAAIKRGETFAAPAPSRLVARRNSTGGIGNLDLGAATARLAAVDRWRRRERARFDRAMTALAGRGR